MVLNVISQNILLDKTRANEGREEEGEILKQKDRIDTLADTLRRFPGSLDIVGIQEAYQSNGEMLAELCDMEQGVWVGHNQKPYPGSPRGRAGEHVGLFGECVNHTARSIELGDNRRAVMMTLGDIAFVTLHLRAGGGLKERAARREQAEHLVYALDQYDDAVVFGDINEPPMRHIAKARDTLREAGFRSVFPLTGQSHPKTFPVPSYRSIHGRGHRWSLDDIQIRGSRTKVLAAGVLKRTELGVVDGVPQDGSDHEGIWARLAIRM